MSEKWTYNTDDEYWGNETFDSKQEAIDAGRELIEDDEPDYLHDNTHFQVGMIIPLAVPSIDADAVLESLKERIYDRHERAGENAFENVTREQENELGNLFNDTLYTWMEKHDLNPVKPYYTISDIEDVPLNNQA